MTSEEERERWVREFIDFWQDQVSHLSTEPEAFAAWLQGLAEAGSSIKAPSGLPPLPTNPTGGDAMTLWMTTLLGGMGMATRAGGQADDRASGTASASASPDDSHGDLEQLARRLDALKARLAAAEREAGGPREATAPGSSGAVGPNGLDGDSLPGDPTSRQ